jgi:anti-sigma-K factor RskA
VHDALNDQVELYVLGVLTPPERAQFERHLALCADCAAAVSALREVTIALALAAPPASPSSRVRERLLASLPGHERRAAHASGRVAAAPDGRDRLPPSSPALAPWLAMAATAVLAVGLALYAAQLRQRINTLETRLREATLRAEASDRQMAEARHAAADAQSTVMVLAAPDLTRVDLAGQPVAPSARARAFWSRSRGLVFTASDLPPLPAGRVYQLWIVGQGAPVSAGLLTPDADGRAYGLFDAAQTVQKPVAFAVTIEPAGGAPAPTGDKYLVGAI